MKQKYTILKSDGQWVLKEFAELDKDIMSLLCEETYGSDTMETAVKAGKERVIRILRTHNMYPPTMYADQIADTIMRMFDESDTDAMDLFFDDKDLFVKESEFETSGSEADDEIEDEEDVDVDELLEPEIDDGFEEKKIIKNIKSSIKVADDDSGSMDEVS